MQNFYELKQIFERNPGAWIQWVDDSNYYIVLSEDKRCLARLPMRFVFELQKRGLIKELNEHGEAIILVQKFKRKP